MFLSLWYTLIANSRKRIRCQSKSTIVHNDTKISSLLSSPKHSSVLGTLMFSKFSKTFQVNKTSIRCEALEGLSQR